MERNASRQVIELEAMTLWDLTKNQFAFALLNKGRLLCHTNIILLLKNIIHLMEVISEG